MTPETQRLREIAKQTVELANAPVQDQRRALWTRHNSLDFTRPPVLVRCFAFDEQIQDDSIFSTHPYMQRVEYDMRRNLMRQQLGDDSILEPYIPITACYTTADADRWGIPMEMSEKENETDAAHYLPQLVEEEDFAKLRKPKYEIDRAKTQEKFDMVNDAIGDIIPVALSKNSICGHFYYSDISTELGYMLGMENMMYYMYDKPEFVHKIVEFMTNAMIENLKSAESAGQLGNIFANNQAMPYCKELPAPDKDLTGLKLDQLWNFQAAQEFALISPEMHKEFLLDYQVKLMSLYGASAYGCCEDLSQKIDILRAIPNLRRIAVTPFANAPKCAEQIGGDYIASWRPHPTMVLDFDPDYTRKTVKEHIDLFKANNCKFDVTLKDVETTGGNPENVVRWLKIVREEINKAF